MRKILITFVLVLGVAATSPAMAQEDMEISVEVGVDALSGYIWRGGILGADDALVLQPSITFGFAESGLSLNIWGSFFAMDRGTTDQADELDFTLDYTASLPDSPVGISIGYIQYTFPSLDGTKHSEELYASLGVDNVLAPSLTVYYDFGAIDDYYAAVAIGPEFPLSEAENAPTLGLSASVGFSGDSYGGAAGFNDLTVGASLGFSAGSLSLAPTLGVTFADEGVNPDTTIWGGLSIGFSN